MKKVFTSFVLLLSIVVLSAQTPILVSPSQWDSLKAAGQLNTGLYVMNRSSLRSAPLQPTIQPAASQAASQATSTTCNCMISIDTTFQVVPFAFSSAPSYRNDDDSSPLITLPFYFCFYGQILNTLYINNNGNISFQQPYGTYSPNGFPDPTTIMIAPFWADVDTQNPASGLVYYKVTPNYMIVRWQTVGYYSSHAGKLNDFQLIISDGMNPILPAGSNTSFCYGDMQWTTGDASNGVGGFGGFPATVGANAGDGINYFQIGTFDQPGNTYNGPLGSPSGVSWLDNQQFFFNICNLSSGYNVAPIMNAAQVCDTLTICVGDTLPITATFLSPEPNETTTITVNSSAPGYNTISNTPGNTAILVGEFVGLSTNIGLTSITILGSDSLNTTSGVVVVNVIAGPTAQLTSTSVCPNTQMLFNSSGSSSVPGNGPITDWYWEFNDLNVSNSSDTSDIQNPAYTYANPGVYTVTLTVTDSIGCSDTASAAVTVYPLPTIQFSATPTTGCPPLCVDFTDLSTVAGSTITDWNWNFGDGNTDTLQNPQNCYQTSNYYTVTLTATSSEGCSTTDSVPQLINVIPGPEASFTISPPQVTVNSPTITCTDLSSGSPASWLWNFGTNNDSSSVQNPTYTYKDTGTYCIQLIAYGPNNSCPDTTTQCIIVLPELLIYVPNAFTPDNNGQNDIFKPVFSDITYISDFRMSIYDRWGNLVYLTADILEGWNGRANFDGDLVPMDTYVYIITFASRYAPEQSEYFGHINVIR